MLHRYYHTYAQNRRNGHSRAWALLIAVTHHPVYSCALFTGVFVAVILTGIELAR